MPKKEDKLTAREAEEENSRAEALVSGKKPLIEESLREARKLEREKVPTKREMTKELENFAEEGEEAKKLLTPWYSKQKSKKKK